MKILTGSEEEILGKVEVVVVEILIDYYVQHFYVWHRICEMVPLINKQNM